MAPIHIVTDSSAQFSDLSVLKRYPITVIPLEVELERQRYREGIDLTSHQFFKAVSRHTAKPKVHLPSIEVVANTYKTVCQDGANVLSIHLSQAFYAMAKRANEAKDTILGRYNVTVFDSQTTSIGLGWLVENAAKLAQTTQSIPDLLVRLRGMIHNQYSVFCVEALDYMRRGGVMSDSQAFIAKMLNLRAIVSVDGGDLTPIDRARTRSAGVARLVEYADGFDKAQKIDQVVVLHSPNMIGDGYRTLMNDLTKLFEDRKITILSQFYKPSLGSIIGPDSLGLFVCVQEDTKPPLRNPDSYSNGEN